MNKQKKKIVIISAVILICFILLGAVMFKMIVENGKCIDDPFRYSAVRLKESGGTYDCSCRSLDPELLDFSFSEEGIKIIKPIDFSNIDISKIELKGGKR